MEILIAFFGLIFYSLVFANEKMSDKKYKSDCDYDYEVKKSYDNIELMSELTDRMRKNWSSVYHECEEDLIEISNEYNRLYSKITGEVITPGRYITDTKLIGILMAKQGYMDPLNRCELSNVPKKRYADICYWKHIEKLINDSGRELKFMLGNDPNSDYEKSGKFSSPIVPSQCRRHSGIRPW